MGSSENSNLYEIAADRIGSGNRKLGVEKLDGHLDTVRVASNQYWAGVNLTAGFCAAAIFAATAYYFSQLEIQIPYFNLITTILIAGISHKAFRTIRRYHFSNQFEPFAFRLSKRHTCPSLPELSDLSRLFADSQLGANMQSSPIEPEIPISSYLFSTCYGDLLFSNLREDVALLGRITSTHLAGLAYASRLGEMDSMVIRSKTSITECILPKSTEIPETPTTVLDLVEPVVAIAERASAIKNPVAKKRATEWAKSGWLAEDDSDVLIAKILEKSSGTTFMKMGNVLPHMSNFVSSHRSGKSRAACLRDTFKQFGATGGYAEVTLGQIYDGTYKTIYDALK